LVDELEQREHERKEINAWFSKDCLERREREI